MSARSLITVTAEEAATDPGLAGRLGAGGNLPAIASRGWLCRLGASPLALRALQPPDVWVPTVRVVSCAEEILVPARWPDLLAAVRDRFTAERLQVRSRQPPERLKALGLGVFQHFVAKRARTREAKGVDVVTAAWPDDFDYVGDLMRTSLRNGMPNAGFTAEQLDQYVRGHLRLGQPGGCEAVIAHVDGERVGTAVYRVEEDELTGERVTRLVDINTTERGHGHGWRIAPAFEAYVARAAALPDVLVGTVVGEDDGSDRETVERLVAAGWRLDYTWWTMAI